MKVDAAWDYIEQGISQIMASDLSQIRLTTETYMNTYTAIHNFCVSSHPPDPVNLNSRGRGQHTKLLGGELYSRLSEYLQSHLKDICAAVPRENVIPYYTRHWQRFVTGATYLDHIFAYLNRHWVKQERDEGGRRRGVYEVYTLCLIMWRDNVFEQLHTVLVPALLKLIEKDRNGEPGVDFQALRTCVESLVAVGFDEQSSKRTNLLFYAEHFEIPFLQATSAYYEQQSAQVLQHTGVVHYMRQVSQWLLLERERVGKYLHPSTEELLMAECERLLIQTHQQRIQKEFLRLLEQNQIDDLHVMYTLLRKVPHGLDPVRKDLQSHVEQTGMARLASEDPRISAADYILVLNGLCVHFERLLNHALESAEILKSAVDDGCAVFINQNKVAKPSPNAESRTPELLARHSDALLKRSSRNANLTHVEAGIEAILKILRYTEDKDVFEKHYARLLSKRLVHQTSANPDLELRMVSRLTEFCGFEYANSLQRMFQDVQNSEEVTTEFREQRSGSKESNAFGPLILARSFWPLPDRDVRPFKLPEPLADTFNEFVKHYERRHSSRRLQWLWNFGRGEMKLNLDSGKAVLLQVSIYQMMILLAFNDADSLTREQLMADVVLPVELFEGSLDYILKAGILLEGPSNVYAYNSEFHSKKMRINLNLPLKIEQSDAGDTQKQIDEQRQDFLQATVVRIMKARQQLSHQELVAETTQLAQHRFVPSIKDVKNAIEALLEREYISRGENDVYEYV